MRLFLKMLGFLVFTTWTSFIMWVGALYGTSFWTGVSYAVIASLIGNGLLFGIGKLFPKKPAFSKFVLTHALLYTIFGCVVFTYGAAYMKFAIFVGVEVQKVSFEELATLEPSGPLFVEMTGVHRGDLTYDWIVITREKDSVTKTYREVRTRHCRVPFVPKGWRKHMPAPIVTNICHLSYREGKPEVKTINGVIYPVDRNAKHSNYPQMKKRLYTDDTHYGKPQFFTNERTYLYQDGWTPFKYFDVAFWTLVIFLGLWNIVFAIIFYNRRHK